MADVNTDFMLPFTMTPERPDGTPVPIDDASIVYASSDETVLQVRDLSTDSHTGNVFPVAAGTARISVTFDADTSGGVVTITGVSEDVNVTLGPSSLADHFTFTFGAPVPKTAPGP